ncbi:MAG: hypothetical protein IKX21_00305 [Deltaproteobacteria bacterium]|nr:hypothetical protein [Deltaproteobacteria bacterium]
MDINEVMAYLPVGGAVLGVLALLLVFAVMGKCSGLARQLEVLKRQLNTCGVSRAEEQEMLRLEAFESRLDKLEMATRSLPAAPEDRSTAVSVADANEQLSTQCPSCGSKLVYMRRMSGRRAKCPACKTVVELT